MTGRRISVFCLAAVSGLCQSSARAQSDSTGPSRAWVEAVVAGRANPAGVGASVVALYRRTMGEAALPSWPAPYLQTGIGLVASPATGGTALHVEWMPVAIAVLRAQADVYGYFGAHGSLLSFARSDIPFGDDERSALAGREQACLAGRFLLRPTVRAKAGPFVLRNQTDIAWYRFGRGGPYVYEGEYDTLLKNGDGLVSNQTAALAELWTRGPNGTLLVGPYYEFRRTFAAGLQRQRLGGLAFYRPSGSDGPAGGAAIFLQTGMNLEDRNRPRQFFIEGGVGVEFGLPLRNSGASP